jgi:hypothetical protein
MHNAAAVVRGQWQLMPPPWIGPDDPSVFVDPGPLADPGPDLPY